MAARRDTGFELKVTGAESYLQVARRLKAAGSHGKGLHRQLRKEIRQETKPIVRALQAKMTSLKVKGSRGGGAGQRREHLTSKAKNAEKARQRAIRQGTGLRVTIARAIRVVFRDSGRRVGVRLEVNTSRLPPEQRTLPRHLDRKGGWRHPVFGDEDTWVSQVGEPWWASTIIPRLGPVRRGIHRAIQRIADQIT